ncbi:AraC family transcriptional regulator [Anaerorhabdus sp.]|uniref:AraC family transcriptional regulator n=1 Tax=Anaerorhabdus sp. TaxID=1872524 RepID=UPI002FC5D851
MKKVHDINISEQDKQEIITSMPHDFPYISSYSEIDKYPGRTAPWHWHDSLEIFYVKSGCIEYNTPKGKTIFTKGQAGIVNSNVLHKTLSLDENRNTVLLLHMFRPEFIGGKNGNIIDKKYVYPFVHTIEIELLQFTSKKHSKLITTIKNSFDLHEDDFSYPIQLRSVLSDIWIQILELSETKELLLNSPSKHYPDDKLKSMMVFIHENYCVKISISDIANAAYISERECYRTFKNSLNLTPLEYLLNYRIQRACHKIQNTQESLTDIGFSCGFSSSSYFGKVFKEYTKYSPQAYRSLWQDNDSK